MRAIDSTARDDSALLADTILQSPQALVPDLVVVETDVDLGAGHRIDVLGVGTEHQPVIIVIDAGDEAAALQRTLRLLQAVRDRAALLNRSFRASGINWSRTPHTVLLSPRISDELARTISELLGHLCISCREYVIADGIGARLVTPARSGAPQVRPVPVAPPAPVNGTRRARANGPAPARREATRPEPAPGVEVKPAESKATEREPVIEAPAREEHGARHLFLEAKKKILRIGDNIEEEVDGDEVRFRVKEGVLAILSLANDELHARSDDPDSPRTLQSDSELDAFLNETFRRYLSLAGRGELPFPVGHPLDRERASA